VEQSWVLDTAEQALVLVNDVMIAIAADTIEGSKTRKRVSLLLKKRLQNSFCT
jgi:hypothetical protein